MTLRKAITYAVPVALATMLGAGSANAFFYNNVYELRDRTLAGDSFDANLAREYKELSEYESVKMYDWIDAENHAVKGNMAATGRTPMPSDPAEWGIEDPARMSELKAARGDLVAALDAGGRSGHASLAATAQAKYDCWVEQQEEGHQAAHIAACRDEYHRAMAALKLAIAPAAEPKTMTSTTVSQEIARETVYFPFDRATIEASERTKIDAFVTRMKSIGNVELAIVGHTDTTGSNDYNQGLSGERARAVASELSRRGMTVRDLNDMDIVAKGEDDLAVSTRDGVREARNRRAEIVAIGEVEVTRQVSGVSSR